MAIETQTRISNAETTLRNRAASQTAEGEDLQKQDFMNLFLTQMSHQDPMKPMDSGAMMAQLAQLGSMEQLENMNGQLGEMNKTQKEMSRFQALNFLDKDVMLETEQLDLKNGTGQPVYYSLDNDASAVHLVIEEKDGSPVYAEDLGLVTAGRHQINWNGKNDEGVMMGDGSYNVRLKAVDAGGNRSDIPLYQTGRISQLEYRKGQPWVKVSDTMVPLSSVSTIDNRSHKLFGDAEPLPIMQDLAPKTISKTIEE